MLVVMSQNVDIVRLQGFRGQFRITIPREMVEKLRWQKGQPLFVSLEGTKVIVEPINTKR
jgi:bifunctional DNA-binding transcriptional regulator/antitoxin component of YhaV-PrlF toxin-antitoxin module